MTGNQKGETVFLKTLDRKLEWGNGVFLKTVLTGNQMGETVFLKTVLTGKGKGGRAFRLALLQTFDALYNREPLLRPSK